MGDHATLPDVLLLLVQFARSHPLRFVLTIPLGGTVALFALFVLFRIFCSGPIGKSIDGLKKYLEDLKKGPPDE